MPAANNLTQTADQICAQFSEYVNPTFVKLLSTLGYGRIYTRAKDVWIWDQQERQYVDYLAAFGAINIGHNHPLLINRLQLLLQQNPVHFCHTGITEHQGQLADKLAALAPDPLSMTLFANSGAEAVDAAIKVARASSQRKQVVYCKNSFHGLSLSTLAIMGKPRMRKPFDPLSEHSIEVTYGDIAELKAILSSKKIAAVILEPIQGEAGVILPSPGYLHQVKDLCKRYGSLLIFDEVQTGLGRTGQWFVCSSGDVVPDILVLAKGLSGGIAAIGVALISKQLFNKTYASQDRFDLQNSTFGGNAFSCVAALETLKIIEQESLVQQSQRLGSIFLEALKQRLADHPLIIDIRGQGLFIGIELGPTDTGMLNQLAPSLIELTAEKVYGQWIALQLLEQGVICQPAAHHWNVIKLTPPLTIKEEQIVAFVQIIGAVFDEYTSISKLLVDVAKRLTLCKTKHIAF